MLPWGFSPCCLADFHTQSIHPPGRLRLETIACSAHCFCFVWLSGTETPSQGEMRNLPVLEKGTSGKKKNQTFPLDRDSVCHHSSVDRAVSPGDAHSCRLAASSPGIILLIHSLCFSTKCRHKKNLASWRWHQMKSQASFGTYLVLQITKQLLKKCNKM